ncbi:MAG: histidinol-phosphate transaminase [Bacteroidaceae bacterium]|nr:histidinol-phosphate transaminase [Bacteroidaceae bacterium]
MIDLKSLVRPNIWNLVPYSCARDEFKGRPASVFLDANENPYNAPINRYPDPLQTELKTMLSPMKQVPVDNMFLGNGSDEAIDVVFRVFCEPKEDNVVAIAPSYGMYQVCAEVNDVEYRTVLLNSDFQVSADAILAACDEHTKVVFLCSPNNPTGNDLLRSEVERILNEFAGIVVLDEAYSDFSSHRPFRLDLDSYPNLIVLNTMSKAWGAAAIRLGMAFADKAIIELMNRVKYPYNVNQLTQERAMETLRQTEQFQQRLSVILHERDHMLPAFAELPICKHVYPTDANFFLARVTDADRIYNYLVDRGIVVRNRNRVVLCGQCLRITIGTPQENCALLAALRNYTA